MVLKMSRLKQQCLNSRENCFDNQKRW